MPVLIYRKYCFFISSRINLNTSIAVLLFIVRFLSLYIPLAVYIESYFSDRSRHHECVLILDWACLSTLSEAKIYLRPKCLVQVALRAKRVLL